MQVLSYRALKWRSGIRAALLSVALWVSVTTVMLQRRSYRGDWHWDAVQEMLAYLLMGPLGIVCAFFVGSAVTGVLGWTLGKDSRRRRATLVFALTLIVLPMATGWLGYWLNHPASFPMTKHMPNWLERMLEFAPRGVWMGVLFGGLGGPLLVAFCPAIAPLKINRAGTLTMKFRRLVIVCGLLLALMAGLLQWGPEIKEVPDWWYRMTAPRYILQPPDPTSIRAVPEMVGYLVLIWGPTFLVASLLLLHSWNRLAVERATAVRWEKSKARVSECPKCGYSLAGLSKGATCPECNGEGQPD